MRTNYLAIVVAGLAYWVLQAAWYTLLGNQWLVAVGKSREELMANASPLPYFISLACDLVIALGLARLVNGLGLTTAGQGARLGAMVGFAFVAASFLTNYAFEQRPSVLLAINAGAAIIGITMMGAITAAWRKKPA